MSMSVMVWWAHPSAREVLRVLFVLAGLFVLGVLAWVVVALPVRGGRGQHAHAGPGTVSVWQLCAHVEAGREQHAVPGPEPEPEEIVWPEHDWPEHEGSGHDGLGHRGPGRRSHYVGRHRLIEIDLMWRPALVVEPPVLRCLTANAS